jgi:hypothetical protein
MVWRGSSPRKSKEWIVIRPGLYELKTEATGKPRGLFLFIEASPRLSLIRTVLQKEIIDNFKEKCRQKDSKRTSLDFFQRDWVSTGIGIGTRFDP